MTSNDIRRAGSTNVDVDAPCGALTAAIAA